MENKQAELIKRLSKKEIILNLYFTQGLLLLITIALSRFIHGEYFYVFNFLWWDWQDLLLGISFALAVVFLEIIGVRYLSERYFDDGGINERVFTSLGPIHIIFISFIIGFSEELLFRGLLQTTFGLIPAAIIFALVHYRYLFNRFLFAATVCLSLLLGLLYMYTGNLLTVIVSHILIDMILGWFIRFGLTDKIKKNKSFILSKEVGEWERIHPVETGSLRSISSRIRLVWMSLCQKQKKKLK